MALIEAIINTALAITKSLPDPFTATAAGIAGGAQVGVIAAQQFATGGKVGKGNIKALPNGDNVLATLTTGEAVLNKDQIGRIGGPSILAAAGVPGFANGGLVGAPSSLVSNVANEKQQASKLLELMQQGIEATNNRVDRLQVVYTASTQDDIDKGNKDREDINLNATF